MNKTTDNDGNCYKLYLTTHKQLKKTNKDSISQYDKAEDSVVIMLFAFSVCQLT